LKSRPVGSASQTGLKISGSKYIKAPGKTWLIPHAKCIQNMFGDAEMIKIDYIQLIL
jgi:hypothetical protein